jgi:hypothetical protein
MSGDSGYKKGHASESFDSSRCRARIAGMQDEELDDYIVRVKGRLVQSHADSYFLEESLLIQLGEACEERTRRQHRFESTRELRRERRHESGHGAEGIGAD